MNIKFQSETFRETFLRHHGKEEKLAESYVINDKNSTQMKIDLFQKRDSNDIEKYGWIFIPIYLLESLLDIVLMNLVDWSEDIEPYIFECNGMVLDGAEPWHQHIMQCCSC